MSDAPKRYRWLRFGVKAMLFFTAILAVVFSLSRQWQLSAQVAEQQSKIADLHDQMDRAVEIVHQYRILDSVWPSNGFGQSERPAGPSGGQVDVAGGNWIGVLGTA